MTTTKNRNLIEYAIISVLAVTVVSSISAGVNVKVKGLASVKRVFIPIVSARSYTPYSEI